jgi:hypothetical protein
MHRLVGNFANDFLLLAPALGLLGNSNFVMTSQLTEGLAHPILGLDVELDITKVLTVASVDTGDLGWSLQLNGYSPQGFNSAWQQYAIYLDNKSSIGKSKTGLLAQMPTLIRRALSEQGGRLLS